MTDGPLGIAIAAAVALAAVIIGSKVQRTCKFLVPYDFVTLSVAIVTCSATVSEYLLTSEPPLEWTLLGAFWAGYLTGYLVVGRTTYTMVIRMDVGGISIESEVIYKEGDAWYVQKQNNRALFDRLVFGAAVRLETDFPLMDDKFVTYHRPLLPRWENRALMVESAWDTVEERRGRLLTHRVCTTHYRLAYASRVSKADLMFDLATLEDMQRQVTDQLVEIHDLRSQIGARMLEHAMQIDMMAKDTTPENRAVSLARTLGTRTRDRVPDVPDAELAQEAERVERENTD